jgi:hypothetical protein
MSVLSCVMVCGLELLHAYGSACVKFLGRLIMHMKLIFSAFNGISDTAFINNIMNWHCLKWQFCPPVVMIYNAELYDGTSILLP